MASGWWRRPSAWPRPLPADGPRSPCAAAAPSSPPWASSSSALALPLSGTGGHSHAAGSAPAETGGAATYTVQPGDTLWTIAERVDPTADPRPLVARLAAQTGSDTVVPGERIVLP